MKYFPPTSKFSICVGLLHKILIKYIKICGSYVAKYGKDEQKIIFHAIIDSFCVSRFVFFPFLSTCL